MALRPTWKARPGGIGSACVAEFGQGEAASRLAELFLSLLGRPQPCLQFRFSGLRPQPELAFSLVLGRRLQIQLRLAGVEIAGPLLQTIDQVGSVQT